MKTLFIPLTIALMCLTSKAEAAAVGPAGYSADFAAAPAATDWSTFGIAGAVADITTSTDLEVVVQLLEASGITAALNGSSANPPGAAAGAVYSEAGYVQTRPNSVSSTVLLATLRNATGSNVTAVTISYNFTTNLPSAEQVSGQLVYYSLTGTNGSWMKIPQFSSAQSGALSATLSVAWADDGLLYLLFADDNGPGTDTACQIDNFSVTTSGGAPTPPRIFITAPLAGTTLLEGVNVTVSAATSAGISNVSFFDGATLIGTDDTAPFSIVYSNPAVGVHDLRAVGNGSVTSAVVNLIIFSNGPPAVTLTTTPGGTVLVGLNIVNTAVVTNIELGDAIARVEFYLDGILRFTDATFPYIYEYCDATAGAHFLQAVAVDSFGARGTNGNTLVATVPPDVTVLIPNGATWKYFDQGVDLGTAWRLLAFDDDTGWSNGVAELGYGDGDGRRPETTVIGFGPDSGDKYPTTYFRKTFTVADASAYANLIVRLLRDDGGIVYLNGVEVFRSYMPDGPVTYNTLAGPDGNGPAVEDDGTFYQVTNVNPALLVNGRNIIAVEIHQEDPASSDLSFDLMLWGQGFSGRTLTITAPAEGTIVAEGASVTINTAFSGGVNSVSFYDGAILIGTDDTVPFSLVYSNLAPGMHALKAVGNGGLNSQIVNIQVQANRPPTVALTTAPGGTVLVGSNIVNTAVVMDPDSGDAVTRVEFYLDGALKFTDTTVPYNYDYCDATAGTHLIEAVAVDRMGARGTNGSVLIAVTPSDVAVLIPNGSTWKYFDQGVDQGTAWRQLAFDDSGWSNGVAELGYGDGAGRRPETTVIGFGTNSAQKYPTTYFRKTFDVADASAYANLVVRLLRDDGGIVYLNGVEVFRSYMPDGLVSYGTLAGPDGNGPQVEDDGTFYQVTNASPSLLVNGPNLVAVEIHQEAPGSSDLSFDLMLWGQGPPLTITVINEAQADVSWPFPSTGYVLKSKADLSAATWDVVSELDFPDANLHHVIIDRSAGRRFFRLERP